MSETLNATVGLFNELEGILARFAEADERLRQAATIEDREEAEAARRDAIGDHWGLTRDLGDLFLLLLRQALRHRRDGLRALLLGVLEPELRELTDAVVRLERSRR